MATVAHRVEVGGRPTRCLVAGVGPPLLLLHGDGTSADEWAWVLPRLARRFRVYAPDLQHVPRRGEHAATPAPAFDTLFVQGLLDALGLPSATLVGNSLGGLAALETALAAPERVDALLLSDSAGLGEAVHPALQALTAPGYGELAIGWASTPVGSLQRAWARAGLLFASAARAPAAWIGLQYRLAQRPGFLAATLCSLRAQVRIGGQRVVLLGQLPRLAMPVQLLWGEGDRVVPPSQAHAACAQLGHGRMAQIADCGHLPHVERPAAFADAVERFLSGHPDSVRVAAGRQERDAAPPGSL